MVIRYYNQSQNKRGHSAIINNTIAKLETFHTSIIRKMQTAI